MNDDDKPETLEPTITAGMLEAAKPGLRDIYRRQFEPGINWGEVMRKGRKDGNDRDRGTNRTPKAARRRRRAT